MKNNITLLLALIAITISWTYLSNNQTLSFTNNQKTNIPRVPDFAFVDIKGKSHTLYAFQKQRIILHFWASWCAPCVKELPELIDFTIKNKNLTTVAIAVRDNKSDIEKFLLKSGKSLPPNFFIGLDPSKSISQKTYGTTKLPETYVINKNLQLHEKIIGAKKDWRDYQ